VIPKRRTKYRTVQEALTKISSCPVVWSTKEGDQVTITIRTMIRMISRPPGHLGRPCRRRLGALGREEHPRSCSGWRGRTRRGELEVRRRRGRCDRHCGARARGAQATVALEHERSRPSSFIIGIEEAQSIIAVRSNPMAIGHCASNKTHSSVSNLTPKHLVSNSDQAPAGGGARAWRRRCTSLAVATPPKCGGAHKLGGAPVVPYSKSPD
jgi:hypothetical protein